MVLFGLHVDWKQTGDLAVMGDGAIPLIRYCSMEDPDFVLAFCHKLWPLIVTLFSSETFSQEILWNEGLGFFGSEVINQQIQKGVKYETVPWNSLHAKQPKKKSKGRCEGSMNFPWFGFRFWSPNHIMEMGLKCS
jgi:hypothetical protein